MKQRGLLTKRSSPFPHFHGGVDRKDEVGIPLVLFSLRRKPAWTPYDHSDILLLKVKTTEVSFITDSYQGFLASSGGEWWYKILGESRKPDTSFAFSDNTLGTKKRKKNNLSFLVFNL